jgi:hypothetical protein
MEGLQERRTTERVRQWLTQAGQGVE